jgi:M6 family metalloprotease-like protein
MKKPTTFRPIYLLILLASCLGYSLAASYGPEGRAIKWSQPTGEQLQLRVFGDEYYGRTENAQGYTVGLNRADKTYYYAKPSPTGDALVLTATKAHEAPPAGMAAHLDVSKAKVTEIIRASRLKYDAERALRWSKRVQAVRKLRSFDRNPTKNAVVAKETKIQAAPVVGNKQGLTILVQFPDVTFPTDQAKIVRYCNQDGYQEDGNTGSIRDYFYDQSMGKLTYTQTVTPIITLPQPRSYYNNEEDAVEAGRKLLTDAINVLKKQDFDFSSLSIDSDNNAIATNIFFAGPDSGVWASGLWPHQSNLLPTINVGNVSNPIIISAYQITNIENAAPTIGTFCHENGHLLLGYPDLYVYNSSSSGVGYHCLMAAGDHANHGKTPMPINGHFKDMVGWGNVTELTPADFSSVSLPSTGNIAYRYRNLQDDTESFVVENRGDGDKWAAFAPDKGIVIWHIDESVDGNAFPYPNYGVSLMQADGVMDIENGKNDGDDGDLFDLEHPKFNDATEPDARWWSNGASGFQVQVLGSLGTKTEVMFGKLPPNSLVVDTPNGGEVVYTKSIFPIRWRASIVGNVKIDLYKGGVFKTVIAANEPNDGELNWKIPASLTYGSNYTIKISSISNIKRVSDSSNDTFTISDRSFPEDGVMPHGWFKPSGASKTWTVSGSKSFEGKHCLVSEEPGDGRKAAVAYRSHFKAGNVSFYLKTSSEKGYDMGRFYIDGEMKALPKGSKGGFSGETEWTFVSFPVSAGKHTFQWTYEKDDSYAELRDRAWLDGVTLPETTQEIAVKNAAGVQLVDGRTTISFPDVAMTQIGAAKTFTITNRGKADLTRLKISTVGANPGDFTISPFVETVLAPGASTTFKVAFSPASRGLKTASVRIQSNDEDESEFAIHLKGDALGVPVIVVKQPDDNKLKDGGKAHNYGSERVGSSGRTKTYTIMNTGSAVLKGLEVRKSGPAKSDFVINQPLIKALAPGAATTFKVTFHPTAVSRRSAELRILSNDKNAGPFDIAVYGKGEPKKKAASASTLMAAVMGDSLSARKTSLPPMTTVEVLDGRKYLSLTVNKGLFDETEVVEVSPNLLDWYSGNKHTTVLLDNETTLKVRDNTPISQDAKRYIRLK